MRRGFLLSLVTFLATGGAAAADVVYSDFGPGQAYSSSRWGVAGSSITSGGAAVAAEFTPAVDATLGSISLGFIWAGSGYANSFGFTLTTSAGGLPSAGAPLETWNSVAAAGSAGSIVTLDSVRNPVLQAGQTYWVTAVPGGTAAFGGWGQNTTGINNHFAISADSGLTWVNWSGPGATPAFEVDSRAAVLSEVPAPAALPAGLALLTGLLGATWLRRNAAIK